MPVKRVSFKCDRLPWDESGAGSEGKMRLDEHEQTGLKINAGW